MPKRVKKKIKFKLIPILIFFIVLIILYFGGSYLINTKIKNIYVIGNDILSDQEVIRLANIEDYPSFYKTFSYTLKKRIKKSELVKDVKIKKKFFNVLKIYIEEYTPVLIKDGKTVLENGVAIDKKVANLPTLSDLEDKGVYTKLIDKLSKLNATEKNQISEIIYTPSEYDNTRFLLYMNDGNHIYINISKLDNLNYYSEIYPTLNGKKGTLYLDSGNHFEPF